MRNAALAAFGLAALVAAPPQSSRRVDRYDQQTLLMNYALSQCIARAYKAPDVVEDARSAAGAYLERGNLPAAAYEALVGLVEEKLTENYLGKSGNQLQLMKCIDAMHSDGLKAIARRYIRPKQ
jgi:hypothetical protein